LTFNEEKIVENSLSLWLGCVLHKEDIIPEFLNFSSDIGSVEELIVRGITHQSRKVREEFYQTFNVFSSSVKNSKAYQFTLNVI